MGAALPRLTPDRRYPCSRRKMGQMQISTYDIRQYKNALIVLPLTDTVPSKVPTQTILGVNYD